MAKFVKIFRKSTNQRSMIEISVIKTLIISSILVKSWSEMNFLSANMISSNETSSPCKWLSSTTFTKFSSIWWWVILSTVQWYFFVQTSTVQCSDTQSVLTITITESSTCNVVFLWKIWNLLRRIEMHCFARSRIISFGATGKC